MALGHPLGNFTINHHAGIRVARDEIRLDVVIDEAEVPTFQDRLELDLDGDGDVSDAEAAAAREPRCRSLGGDLALFVAGSRVPLALDAAGLSFSLGAGGLPTLRLVCEFRAPLHAPIVASTPIAFTDGSFAGRLGWREIVALGDGVTLAGSHRTASVSRRLTTYPADLLAHPLADASLAVVASPGGPAADPFSAPDAEPVAAAAPAPAGDRSDAGMAPPATATASAPYVPGTAGGTGPSAGGAGPSAGGTPGGIGTGIDALLRTRDLDPFVLALSMLVAAALGAGHALTPGHGKTLMAAVLVGTRGTVGQAVGLALAVALSHTAGVLALALVVLGAGAALPPDLVARWAPLASGVVAVAIGLRLLAAQLRPPERSGHAHGHAHPHAARAEAPAPPDRLSHRALATLGLAGGIVPSANALLILLATIATGRSALGVLLVACFGLGMATVMVSVGVLVVAAGGWLDRRPGRTPERLSALAPVAGSLAVLVVGVVVTAESLLGSPAF